MPSKAEYFDEISSKIDQLCEKISNENLRLVNEHRLDFYKQQLKLIEIRDNFLPRQKFSEVCWSILVELYTVHIDGFRYSVSDIGRQADLPLTTILRSLHSLQAEGFIVRTPDPEDKRRSYVCITKHGQSVLDRIFSMLNGNPRNDPQNCNAPSGLIDSRRAG